jgi:hypothetical protein
MSTNEPQVQGTTEPNTPSAAGQPGPGARRGRKALLVAALVVIAAAVIVLVVLGQKNRRGYHLVCGGDAITAEQGRSFPPWGQSALRGDAWRSIPVAPSTPCTSQTFASRQALAQRFEEMLVARAEAWVIGRADGVERERLAEVQARIDQARLLLVELSDPAVAEGATVTLERLQGDIDYWRARDEVDAAMAALEKAAAQLDQAVTREPRHNAEDAAAWRRLLGRIRQELASGPHARPGAVPGAMPGSAAQPGATPGPDRATASPPAGDAAMPGAPDADAGAATPASPGAPVAPDAPRQPAPDAGVPRGGQFI